MKNVKDLLYRTDKVLDSVSVINERIPEKLLIMESVSIQKCMEKEFKKVLNTVITCKCLEHPECIREALGGAMHKFDSNYQVTDLNEKELRTHKVLYGLVCTFLLDNLDRLSVGEEKSICITSAMFIGFSSITDKENALPLDVLDFLGIQIIEEIGDKEFIEAIRKELVSWD